MNLMDGLITEDYEDKIRVPGITIGIVKENWEEKHPGMVKVEINLGEKGKNVTGWVPVMSSYAGEGYGNYILPEVGQKVVIGFHFGDRNYPIVLGCLWDQKNKIPEKTANKDNTLKKFITKGGSTVVFNDEKGKETITVTTPAKLSLSIEDETKVIKIKDENAENTIEMDCQNGNLTFQAKTKMEFKIGTNAAVTIEENSITLKSKTIEQNGEQKVAINGQNVNVEGKSNVAISAQANVNIEGKAGAKVNASGVLELKGSLVKVN